MKYIEDINATLEQKKSYLFSVEELIKTKMEKAKSEREKNLKNIIKDTDSARKEYLEMLGWPLTETVKDPISVKKTLLSCEEEGYNIYRMKFEIFENFFFYGLYFEYRDQKLPFVISQHGGNGTPELCSGIYDGNTANYNHMTERVFKRGAHVFAPQTLLWHKEKYGLDYNRENLDYRLKQLGGSLAALEIYCIKSAINYFEKLPCVDSKRIGMIGLSYGGFYTLYTTAADTRIKSALSCAFFNDRCKYSWFDFTWKNSAYKFFDSEVALLCYPRKLCLSVGEGDTLFDVNTAKIEYERLCDEIKMCGIEQDWVNLEVHSGGHEVCVDDKTIDDMVKALKEDNK